MRVLQVIAVFWGTVYDVRVWLAVQLLHGAWTVSKTSWTATGLGDHLSCYLEGHWPMVALLSGLLIPHAAFRLVGFPQDAGNRFRSQDQPMPKGIAAGRLSDPVLVLDSNIWMNPDLDGFFSRLGRQLKTERRKLLLFGPQFDELCNIKDRIPYGTQQGRLARLALSRIERLQVQSCLTVDPLLLQAKPKTFADPLILELIRNLTSSGQSLSFVTDDRELRIRARQIAQDAPGKLTVRRSGDLVPGNHFMSTTP